MQFLKGLSFISMLLLAFCFTSCGDDGSEELNFDGDNFSAPILVPGVHECAARFIPALLEDFAGRQIVAINYFMKELPDEAEIKIYGESGPSEPGAVLYSRDITNEMQANSWNLHTVSSPITLNGIEDLWISIKVVHFSDKCSVGCDEGPADTNGDFYFSEFNNFWTSFRSATNQETSINWNIRAVLDE